MSGRLFHSKYKPGNWERAVTPCGAAPAACPPCRDTWGMPGVPAERIRISQNVLALLFFSFVYFAVFFFLGVIKEKKAFTLHSPFFNQTFLIYFILLGENNFIFLLFFNNELKKSNLLLCKVLIWDNL